MQTTLAEVKVFAEQLDLPALHSSCPHTGAAPWPPLPSHDKLLDAARHRVAAVLQPPQPVSYDVPAHVSAPLAPAHAAKVAPSSHKDECTPATKQESGAEADASSGELAVGWTLVTRGRKAALPVAPTGSDPTAALCTSNQFTPLMKTWAGAVMGTSTTKKATVHVKKAATAESSQSAEVAAARAPTHSCPQMTATALKNLKRKLKRKAAAKPVAAPAACAATARRPPSEVDTDCSGSAAEMASLHQAGPAAAGDDLTDTTAPTQDWLESVTTTAPTPDLLAIVRACVVTRKHSASAPATGTLLQQGSDDAAAIDRAMGRFGVLGQDVLGMIMARLAPEDTARLGATCRGLRMAAKQDGVWQHHLRQLFPTVEQLAAVPVARWRQVRPCCLSLKTCVHNLRLNLCHRYVCAAHPHSCRSMLQAFGSLVLMMHSRWSATARSHTGLGVLQAYLLEANHVVPRVTCYASGVSPLTSSTAVLGMPLQWTVNPRTRQVDYIEASPDLLSLDAFSAGVCKTPSNGHVQGVLPVFLTQAHFERALPHLHAILRQLAPTSGNQTPPPTAWLTVLPRIMNTAITLLCSEGVVNGDAATVALCHVHRLMLALTQHYNLWAVAEGRVRSFLTDSSSRTKSGCPSLGWLLPLLCLTPKFTVRQVLPVVLKEARDRSVLWLCKEFPAAAKSLQAALPERDATLLANAWAAGRVSQRLIMFHALFISTVACPAGRSLEAVMHGYDLLLGMPSNRVCDRMRVGAARMMSVGNHAASFAALGLVYPGDAWQTAELRKAWLASLRKGYHKKGMDFTKVQRSGVSKILLKGAQYSAPPTLSKITVTDHWRWASRMRYFDASCVAVRTSVAADGTGAVEREIVDEVNFSSCRSMRTRVRGAMTHSGDMMTWSENAGHHTMSINLAGLGFGIDELYFIGSVYCGGVLRDILQPFVSIADPDTGMQLCGYSMENDGASARERHSAVVMCRVFRGNGRWHVQALGETGQGDLANRTELERTLMRIANAGAQES